MLNTMLAGVAVTAGLWIVFALVLVVARPESGTLREGMRLLPDTLRLVRRLAADPNVPRSARVLVWLLLGYLVLPIDLVPDFLPMIGYADDLILTALVLRYLVRQAGHETLEEQWPGTEEGLTTLRALLRLPVAAH
jgi:uncharacterized membrane protein YkvA (DUF1232 family)